jgi:nitroreductase
MDLTTVDKLLTTTRSVRKRLDLTRPVEPEVIAQCLDIATQAPTGGHICRYHFVVVTDPVKRQGVAASTDKHSPSDFRHHEWTTLDRANPMILHPGNISPNTCTKCLSTLSRVWNSKRPCTEKTGRPISCQPRGPSCLPSVRVASARPGPLFIPCTMPRK